MDIIGCLLLISGWALAVAALLLLSGGGQRLAFLLAALLVEVIGLALVLWNYRTRHRPADRWSAR